MVHGLIYGLLSTYPQTTSFALKPDWTKILLIIWDLRTSSDQKIEGKAGVQMPRSTDPTFRPQKSAVLNWRVES